MPGMPRENEPARSDAERGVRDVNDIGKEGAQPPRLKARRKYAPMTPLIRQQELEERRRATEELGETSDEYGQTSERDHRTDMTEGEDIARTSPDVITESPTGMGETEPPGVRHGFAEDRDRPD